MQDKLDKIPTKDLIKILQANVANKDLTDSDFRLFIADVLPMVEDAPDNHTIH
jgi:hypothetical protein